MKRMRLFCVLLAAAMLLSLAACGKDDPKESNSLQIGDYALLYKGASIMEDSDGNDALVLTLDFTNNSKDSSSYVWCISETVIRHRLCEQRLLRHGDRQSIYGCRAG